MNQKPIQVFINRKKYDLDHPVQTGTSLKQARWRSDGRRPVPPASRRG